MVTKHTLTPPDCFSWVTWKKCIHLHWSESDPLLFIFFYPYIFSLALPVVLFFYHLSDCKVAIACLSLPGVCKFHYDMMMTLRACLKCVSPLAQKFVGFVYLSFFFHHSLIFLFFNCNALCDLSGENGDRKTSALNSNYSGIAYSKNMCLETSSHYVSTWIKSYYCCYFRLLSSC